MLCKLSEFLNLYLAEQFHKTVFTRKFKRPEGTTVVRTVLIARKTGGAKKDFGSAVTRTN